MKEITKREDTLFENISRLIDEARKHVKTTVNTAMVYTYYGIGKHILAKSGEHVVLKSRAGSFRIFPEDSKETIDAPRDLMKELKNALAEVKEATAGKRVLQSADSLLNEL